MPLLLLPNVLRDEQPVDGLLPGGLDEKALLLDALIAESERAGRRYLLKLVPKSRGELYEKMRTLPIVLLNEHSDKEAIDELVRQIMSGKTLGLVSDCGLPCVADPGSQLVAKLQEKRYSDIQAYPGPSSIFLSLMLSGLSGQRFAFHGYIAKNDEERAVKVKEIERRSVEFQETQIWIETPYRNAAMIKTCLESLNPTTRFAVATNITFPNQKVISQSISRWKDLPQEEIDAFQGPTVFLLFATQASEKPKKEKSEKEQEKKRFERKESDSRRHFKKTPKRY